MNRTALATYFCLFLSGMAGLIYEILWSKYLALFVGSTGMAHVVVLCTFMGGMALGGHVLGRWADRLRRPLAFYAYLELAIALYALLFGPLFAATRSAFLGAVAVLGVSAGSLLGAKVLACIMTILVPSFLMGGTLPVISRHLIRQVAQVGQVISRLYFINSLGAVMGCLLGGFYLVSSLGLQFTMVVGAMFNVAAGVVALILGRMQETAEISDQKLGPQEPAGIGAANPAPLSRGAGMTVLLCVAASGAVSMLYEVGWIRLLTLVLGSSTYSFSLMLATFILGLSLGGLILSMRRTTTGYGLIFGLSEVGVGLLVLISLPFYVRLPYWFNQVASSLSRDPETFGLYQGAKFLLCAIVMFLPTVLQGITLPAATQVLTRETRSLGGRVGTIFAVNTLGTLLGAATAGGLLMPTLGIKGLLELAVGANLLLGLAVLVVTTSARTRRVVLTTAMAAMVVVVGGYVGFMGPWNKEVMSAGVYRTRDRIPSFAALDARAGERTTRWYRDGLYATVAVQDIAQPQPQRMLVINGKVDASSGKDLSTQKGMAHIPMMIHAGARKVLVVGVGSGATIGSVLSHPGVEQVDVVEISPDVIAASHFFEAINGRYWEDPRVNLYQEDAKTFLHITPTTYDLIISEPTNPWIAGVAGVFSQEYFLTCQDHLAEGGLFVQWIQAYELEDPTFFLMLETFTSVYPHYTLWNTTQSDTILVGSAHAYRPDFARFQQHLSPPDVREDLATMGVSTMLPLLAMQMVDHATQPSHVPWFGILHTDLFPVLEYAAPRGFYLGSKADGVKLLDERSKTPATARLWVVDYLQTHLVTSDAFREVYLFVDANRGLFEKHRFSWATVWHQFHPDDVQATLALASAQDADHTGVAEALQVLGEAGAEDWRPFAARLSLQRAMTDYEENRHALSSLRARALLEEVDRVGETWPDQCDPEWERWKGALLADLGETEAATTYLSRAMTGLPRNEARVATGIRLAGLLLEAGRLESAVQVFDQHLAPHLDLLPVYLLRARITAALGTG